MQKGKKIEKKPDEFKTETKAIEVKKKKKGPILKKKGSKKRGLTVRFSVETKIVDGFTARMYSRPDYLKLEGGFLKPKSSEQIIEEIRLGIIVEPKRQAANIFIDEDSSDDEPYEPDKPNNYELYCRELARRKQRIQNAKREALERQKAAHESARLHEQQQAAVEQIAERIAEKTKEKEQVKNKNSVSFAQRQMMNMGWKPGDGLGKQAQGIKASLAPGRNNVPTMVMDSSRILRLQNMVGPGEVDDALCRETGEECSKFGTVLNCIVHETTKKVPPEHAVNIFVEFLTPIMAEFAIQAFNGRFFAGRRVLAAFFPEKRYAERDLDPGVLG